jgi:hypothetical protein
MTKAAEHPPSSPEPSSHGFHEPLTSDTSRWWERPRDFASPRTLTGLGPFAHGMSGSALPRPERFRAAAALELDDLDVVELAEDDEDDVENEPTRLLTRSLLQMAPAAEANTPASPRPEGQAGQAESEWRSLDCTYLDQFAQDVTQNSVLRNWMTQASGPGSAPRIAAPAAFGVASTVPTPAPWTSRWRLRVPLRIPGRSVAVALAGLVAVALTLTLLASREGGTRASEAREVAPAEPASLHVRTETPGVQVSLDGQPRGLSPLLLRNLSPTAHRLRLDGNRGYAAYEQTIVLEPGKVLAIEPVLVPVRAVIDIRAGANAEGALIELIGDGRRREFRELPARVEVTPSESYRVRAQRPGYRDYSAEISFDEAELEKVVQVEFAPVAAASLPLVQRSPSAPLLPPAAAQLAKPNQDSGGETLVRVKPGAGAALDGSASLSVNSIPISTVIVDGRPQGLTPKVLSVTPGVHSVVFLHPSLGRRSLGVDVSAGTTAVAAVRF